jgi:hypothetical protein
MGSVDHLTAQRMHLPPANDEFIGMADYVTESFYDLLVGDSEGDLQLRLYQGKPSSLT